VPFVVAIHAARGLADRAAPSLYEGLRRLTGRAGWEMFRYITYPLLTPIIAVVMDDVLCAVHLHRLPADLGDDAGAAPSTPRI